MRLRRGLATLIIANFGILCSYGQYFTRLGIGLDTRTNVTIPVVVADPNDPQFSGELLAGKYPDLNITAGKIDLVYPLMPDAADTVAILWYLRPEEISAVPGEMNIIIVEITPDNRKKYWFDNNNDRVFSSSETSFIFRNTKENREVKIMVAGSYYPYTIINTDYSPPVSPSISIRIAKSSWHDRSRKPSLAIDLSASSFWGNSSLSYVRQSRPSNTLTYYARIPGSIRPVIGLDFSWYNFHLMLSGGYEKTKYTENILVSTDGGSQSTSYNSGTWPSSRLILTLGLEYDISAGRYLYLTPFGAFSTFKNDTRFAFNRNQGTPAGAEYSDLKTYEAGLKLKLPVDTRVMLHLGLAYSSGHFNAEKYFTDILPGSYNMQMKGFYYSVGVNFNITGLSGQDQK